MRMRSLPTLALIAALALSSLGSATPPPDDDPTDNHACVRGQVNQLGVFTCFVEGYIAESGGNPDHPDGPSEWRPGPPRDVEVDEAWATWWEAGLTSGLRPCYYIAGGWFSPSVSAQDQAEQLTLGYGTGAQGVEYIIQRLLRDEMVGPCTSTADFQRDAAPPAMPSREQLIDIIRVVLPTPDVVIEPGRGLAGLEMWLETRNRPQRFSLTQTVLEELGGNLVRADVVSTFTVDWGDDTVTGPFDRPGIRWQEDYRDNPERISHTWINAGDYTVTVTDTWTIDVEDQWGRTATVTFDLPTSIAFPVDELQPVIVD